MKTETVVQKKILVVDDNPSVIALMLKILQSEFTISSALNGEDALKTIRTFKPDVVLLDVTMPGIDGYEVCKIIRSQSIYDYVKVIMVSSGTILQERLKGYQAGADDYICKPFNQDELLAKIRVFVRLKIVEDQLNELNDTLEEKVRMRSQQLVDAEKLAGIGRYAAGIVHNLKNPLQVIMGEGQLFALEYPENRNIMALIKAANQMKNIIGTILTTSHRESKEIPLAVDLNQVLKDQLELLKANHFFKYNVRTEVQLSPLPPYMGMFSHFSQSFGNLIKNAIEAMYDSKTKIIKIISSMKNDIIYITIADSGHGISPDKMEIIFDPFFTTKPLTAKDGRPTGTGLGLASCKEMIESYGGRIKIKSIIGRGTAFIIELPLKQGHK